MKPTVWMAGALCTTLLAACQGQSRQAAEEARAAEQTAQREAAALSVKQRLDEAINAGEWEVAHTRAGELQQSYAGTQAAREAEARFAEVESEVKKLRAQRRLERLWDYQRNPAGKGQQVTAAIDASNRVDTAIGRSTVKLIFRDHPEWGRSSYLVLERGDFDCYRGCSLKLSVDGQARTLRGSRPDTDEAIAMFITDERALWRIFKDAEEVTIEFPMKDKGRVSATFESGGLDPTRMPW